MPVFRRRILIKTDPLEAGVHYRAALEDDFHHFRVDLVVRDGRIVSLRGEAPRHPYSLCPSAADQLQLLIGTAPDASAHAVMRLVDPGQQCTHLLELSGLAIAAAARALPQRRYDIEVPLRVEGRTQATLDRDGTRLLAWDVQDFDIEGPPPYSGIGLRQGMARWALANLSEDMAEAALVLRRCAVISMGKNRPLDAQKHARPTSACFAQQQERAPLALRQVGSTWNFTWRPDQLCRDDQAWMDFKA
ncbi:MAG: DUF2889 domain-containing protein [Hydrogenophaga sp.]|uniref:DUF2889 domain-containing protein n=1 Tax=Hydrogenophaga sp. TaxID=1904254 RepID=UPI002ABA5F97|nr:DUF2889 domain-containing protein [Hydrogenophaga sp.]MDZ4101470.1 DUF2889 domain-containing protein [Hydrogenophaga sp.]